LVLFSFGCIILTDLTPFSPHRLRTPAFADLLAVPSGLWQARAATRRQDSTNWVFGRIFDILFGEGEEILERGAKPLFFTPPSPGKTAKGRWNGWGAIALPKGGIEQIFIHGIYEMVYVKEGGTWKIKIFQFNRTYSVPRERAGQSQNESPP
jgi:hypothetical protein